MSYDLDFSSVHLIQLSVKGPDGNDYVLREASGDDHVAYRNFVAQRQVYNDKGKLIALKDIASCEPYLVSLCLKDSKGNGVSQKVIGSWPGHVQKALFRKAQEISKLAAQDETKGQLLKALESNSSPVTKDTFLKWVSELDEEFAELKEWLESEVEEEAKN